MSSMKPVILFRSGLAEEGEMEAAGRHFDVVTQRAAIPPDRLVIPRYASLPYHAELEADVRLVGSELINTTTQHRFVADIREWYPIVRWGAAYASTDPEEVKRLHEHTPPLLTPRTWTDGGWHDLPEGQFVVKGTCNSRKHEWQTRMFAPSRAHVSKIVRSLLDDSLLADQGIVVREYVPLRTFMTGLNGLPITNEWRYFCLDGKIVDSGYYWASEPDCEWLGVDPNVTVTGKAGEAPPPLAATSLVKETLRRITGRVRFVVVDVAEKASGGWIVIELNDGAMSGLSMIPPDRFYKNLAAAAFRSQILTAADRAPLAREAQVPAAPYVYKFIARAEDVGEAIDDTRWFSLDGWLHKSPTLHLAAPDPRPISPDRPITLSALCNPSLNLMSDAHYNRDQASEQGRPLCRKCEIKAHAARTTRDVTVQHKWYPLDGTYHESVARRLSVLHASVAGSGRPSALCEGAKLVLLDDPYTVDQARAEQRTLCIACMRKVGEIVDVHSDVCPDCGKRIRAIVPKGGDGSAQVFVRHTDSQGAWCPGSRRIVPKDERR